MLLVEPNIHLKNLNSFFFSSPFWKINLDGKRVANDIKCNEENPIAEQKFAHIKKFTGD